MRRIFFAPLLGTIVASSLLATTASAQGRGTPFVFSFGSQLLDGNGAAVKGPVDVELKFFRQASGGDPLPVSQVVRSGVQLAEDGVFQIDITELLAEELHSVFDAGKQTWIEVIAAGKAYPRQMMIAVPYAMKVPTDNKVVKFNSKGQLTLDIGDEPGSNEFLSKRSDGTWEWKTPDSIPAAASSIGTKSVKTDATPASGEVLKFDSGQDKWVPGALFPTGGNNQYLMRNGGGDLAWGTPSGAGDMQKATYDSAPQDNVVDNAAKLNGQAASYYLNNSNHTGVVPDGNLPAASTSALGIVELATAGETAAGLAVQANDARLSDARAPTGAAGGNLTGTYPNPTIGTGQVTGSHLSSSIAISTSGYLSSTSYVEGALFKSKSAGGVKIYDSDNTNFVLLQPAATGTLTSDVTFTLPADVQSGKFLTTNGAGVLSWDTPAGAGDITDVTAGTGLTGGAASGNATLNVDVGTTAGQIVQMQAGPKLPAVDGSDLTSLNASNIATGTIADARLSANVSLLGSSIESSEITNGTIVTADISGSAITSAEIATDTIVAADIATGAVGSDEILNGTIVTADISGSAITSAEIAADTIVAADIATGAVGSDEVVDESLTSLDLATGSVGNAEIADNSITGADVNTSTTLTIAGVNADNQGTVKFYEQTGNGSNYARVIAPAALAANTEFVLPPNNGTNGYFLQTDGAGVTSWSQGLTLAGGTMTGQLSIMGSGSGSPGLAVSSDPDTGIFSGTANTLSIATGGTERVTVNASGNVGVGTAAPSARLEVYENTTGAVGSSVKNAGTNTASHAKLMATTQSTGGDPYVHLATNLDWSIGIDNDDSDKLKFAPSGTVDTSTAMTIDTAGNVGVGATAPSAKFHVAGTSAVALLESTNGDVSLQLKNNVNANAYVQYVGTDMKFFANSAGTPTMTILGGSPGSVGIGTTAPSAKLHATAEDGATNTVATVLRLNHSSTGTPANSFGSGLLFSGESSSTDERDMARVQAVWTNATDASRSSALQFQTLSGGGALTTQVIIDGTGKVGIGTSTASAMLDVAGDAKFGAITTYGAVNSQFRLIKSSNSSLSTAPGTPTVLTSTDHYLFVDMESNPDVYVQLPSASGIAGRVLVLRGKSNLGSAPNDINITTAGGTINGGSSTILDGGTSSTPGKTMMFISDGTNWFSFF